MSNINGISNELNDEIKKEVAQAMTDERNQEQSAINRGYARVAIELILDKRALDKACYG